jgi:hypothetical protein
MLKIYAAVILYIFSSCLRAEIVTVSGKSANDTPSAREQALTDALREAVRVGAGVNLTSQSQSKNFSLDYDRIFAASFGYVKSYQVIESGKKSDGFYHVKLKAEVIKGDPNINEKLALKQLIALKKSPIIGIDIQEDITFVPKNSGYAKAWFHEFAKELQLNVTDLKNSSDGGKSIAQGDLNSSSIDIKNSRKKVDFLIRGKIEAKYQILADGDENPYSITANFEAVSPETGEIIAVSSLSPNDKIKTKIESPQLAAKTIIQKCLSGSGEINDDGASVLFRRIFARWASDLDLGRTVRLRIDRVDDKTLRAWLNKIGANDKISDAIVREFDSKNVTTVDIVTRLNSQELIQALQESSRFNYLANYATESVIFLIKDETPSWKKYFNEISRRFISSQ